MLTEDVPPRAATDVLPIIALNEFPMHAEVTNNELSIRQAVNRPKPSLSLSITR